MRTCSCGARTPMSSSSCSGASLIGADSGLRSVRACSTRGAGTGVAGPLRSASGNARPRARASNSAIRRSGKPIARRFADAGDHRMQAIETALEQRNAIAPEFAALVDDRFEQRLHRVAEFAHGHDAGHARAALDRVQVALQVRSGARARSGSSRSCASRPSEWSSRSTLSSTKMSTSSESRSVRSSASSGSSADTSGLRDQALDRAPPLGFGVLGAIRRALRRRHVRLRRVRLRRVRLRRVRLRRVRLRRARLRRVRLRRVRLRRVRLRRVRLRRVRLRRVRLRRVRLRARSASARSASARSASARSASARSASARSASTRSASTRSASTRSASARSASARSASSAFGFGALGRLRGPDAACSAYSASRRSYSRRSSSAIRAASWRGGLFGDRSSWRRRIARGSARTSRLPSPRSSCHVAAGGRDEVGVCAEIGGT